MNKTMIEWCTHTNPDAYSCLHGCNFCYAIKIIKRFPMNFIGINQSFDRILDLNPLVSDETITELALKPHINLKALYAPADLKKPAIIFRGSMTDLFGDWWTTEYIETLFKAMVDVNHHKYIILTKNPKGLFMETTRLLEVYPDFEPDCFNHVYFGTSVSGNNNEIERSRLIWLNKVHVTGFNTVISFEPLLQDPKSLIEAVGGIAWADWIIIGGQTNPVRIPEMDKILSILKNTRSGQPVFCKNNIGPGLGEHNRREFPADLVSIARSWGKL